MRPAVIVTTYNRPDALALVLEGYSAQSTRDFALLVARHEQLAERGWFLAVASRAPYCLLRQ